VAAFSGVLAASALGSSIVSADSRHVKFDQFPTVERLRNRHIVDEVDLMFAKQLQNEEIVRSGTWCTIRYAARSKVKRLLVIVWPDGTIEKRLVN
jgi:hypothetical protein